jgi:uncharacterized membrane protein (UPF0182 family)
MIPIGNGNMFVEPIYLQAQTSQLPELKRVVVVNGNRIAMEPTLERSLAVIFGEAAPTAPSADPNATPVARPTEVAQAPTATPVPATPTPAATTPPLEGDVSDLARQAEDAFERAQVALQQGDFATYGEEINLARALIAQIVALTAEE